MQAGNKRPRDNNSNPKGTNKNQDKPKGKNASSSSFSKHSSNSNINNNDNMTLLTSRKTAAREAAEIKELTKRIETESPAPGSLDISISEFTQLPLSRYTLQGLKQHKFTTLTQIQRIGIPHALAGRDILGAAKTGSGKTLAFIIPVLERLFRNQWTNEDGLGAIIISPTRELAMQIFEVLKIIGKSHFALSAGLITGGKDFEEEANAITRMAILVATPGRLLQHLEQTPNFTCENIQILVLDEADRLLDLGFADTLNSILKYLPGPPQRQTLLFSATQTKSVKDLARLSLSYPEYLAVHEKAESVTPARLSQHYVVCRLPDKLNLLFSFLRTHTSSKIIVFLSSCKESQYLFEAFRRLRPGIPLQLLHGKMKQTRRMLVYYDFLKKPEGCLFATDIAARGLDFPDVDWVIQLDCPEDVPTYIHRVGRTARFRNKGHALLVLLPSEVKAMIPLLQNAKIPINQTKINQNTAISITGKLSAEVAADTELKRMAQKAFLSYARSVYLQSNKDIFRIQELPFQEYGESLGLAIVPEVKYGKNINNNNDSDNSDSEMTPEQLRAASHAQKNQNKALARLKAKIAEEKAKRKENKENKIQSTSSKDSISSYDSSDEDDFDDDDDDDILEDDETESEEEEETNTKMISNKSNNKTTKTNSKTTTTTEEDEFFRPKKSTTTNSISKSKHTSDDEDDDYVLNENEDDNEGLSSIDLTDYDIANLTKFERQKIEKIIQDTKLLGSKSGGLPSKIDGLTPFQRIAISKALENSKQKNNNNIDDNNDDDNDDTMLTTTLSSSSSTSHIAKQADYYAQKIAKRLSSTSTRDKERERERIRTKHREERLRAKGKDIDNDNNETVPEVRLGGVDDDDNNTEEDDYNDDNNGQEDDDNNDNEVEIPSNKRSKSINNKVTSNTSSATSISNFEKLAKNILSKKSSFF